MIVLRQAQVVALRMAHEREFVAMMVVHLRTHFRRATESLDDEELTQRIRDAIAAARSFGLDSERDLCRFLNLCATWGWTFHQEAWAAEMLTRLDVTDPTARLDLLVAESIHRLEVETHNAALARQFGMAQ